MSTNSSKWKKALLPTLGNRRRGRDPTSRLPASRTGALFNTGLSRFHAPNQRVSNKPQVSDISVTAAILHHEEETALDSVDDEVDERVVSVLLETTNEAENESQSAVTRKV